MVVRQALDSLFTNDFFSICTVDKILVLVDRSRRTPAYELLSALHCVHYRDMNPELRDKIPHLVNEAMRPPPRCIATDTAMADVEVPA